MPPLSQKDILVIHTFLQLLREQGWTNWIRLDGVTPYLYDLWPSVYSRESARKTGRLFGVQWVAGNWIIVIDQDTSLEARVKYLTGLRRLLEIAHEQKANDRH